MSPSKTMNEKVQDYLSYRRRLGFQLKEAGRQLRQFARYADGKDTVASLTTAFALGWVTSDNTSTRFCRARRLEVIRPFARYLSLFEPQTEIPPAKLFGPAHRRTPPYIYSPEEITSLMNEARKLIPTGGLRPRTYATLIGLMAATGLRTGEALRLERRNVDLPHGILTIRETKYHASRLIPLAPSAVEALKVYSEVRDASRYSTVSTRFLVSQRGKPLLPSVVYYTFQKLRQTAGVGRYHTGRPPRLYDLRHTFASRRLLQWYREGVDVNRAIVFLSTYLGHVKVSDTYWYLTALPELFAIVGRRFEKSLSPDGLEVGNE